MSAQAWLTQLRRPSGALLAAFLVPLALLSCSDDDDPTAPLAEPAVSVALGSSSVTVVQGRTDTVPVTITRTGGFGGTVALSLVGAPTGLTGTFDPASLPAGASTSILTVAATGSLAPGVHGVTVRATGDGISNATAALELTVTPGGGFSLNVTPSELTVNQGTSETAALEIDRTGEFSGVVSLSATGAPSGLTITMDPAAASGISATVTADADGSLEPGSYPVTIHGSAEVHQDETQEEEVTLTVTVTETTGGSWVQLSAGQNHTCAVDEAGDAYCWGRNEFGQLGDGTTTNQARPRLVEGGHTWTSVTSGTFHTCGITAVGDGFCWGNGNFGLGDGSTGSSSTPQPIAVSGDDTWGMLSAGWYFTCGLTPDGRAYCWGRNSYGVLGDGTGNTQLTPVPVAGDHRWRTISTGESHTCGVTTAGEAYCWGSRMGGRVGDGGNTGNVFVPVLVEGGHTWGDVSAESWHTCGVTTAGAGHCWGFNQFGQLGIGNTQNQTTPTPVLGNHVWTELNPGSAHITCGIIDGGDAYCWGANAVGQVGIGTESRGEETPQLVSGELRWSVVSAGLSHTCGITEPGVAYCWGAGIYGQLGNGSAGWEIYSTPIRILDPE
jgi:alpha-tubulin suppressor-like RCC1 family protein